MAVFAKEPAGLANETGMVSAKFGWTITGKEVWTVEMSSQATTMDSVRKIQTAFLNGFLQAGILGDVAHG